MINEIAFTLPKEFVKRLYVRRSPAVIIGIVFLLQSLNRSASFSTGFAIFICAMFICAYGLFYWYTAQYKYVFVSSTHLRGKSYFPKRPVSIPWSDEVTVQKKNTTEGIHGYEVTAQNSRYALFLPEEIALHPDFNEAVARYAPANHKLLALL